MKLTERAMLILMLALTTAAADPPAQSTGQSPPGYVPVPGDVLEIQVYAGGEKQEDFNASISPAGTISCPLLGEMRVSGLSVATIASRMRQTLARDYYVSPDVLVGVRDYGGKVYILGEVRHPGVYPVQSGLTALGACDLAGGFTDFAAPRHARLMRIQGGKPTRIDLDLARVRQGRAADFLLQGEDRIEVPHRWF